MGKREIILALFSLFLLQATAYSLDFESRLQFFEYCRYYNYPVEDHTVHTDDRYNLQFYRLQAKNTKIVPKDKVIYLQHGLADSGDTWIVNDENLAPGFYLANLGYDVWVGNSRGNRYSTKELSPKVKNFWNFTFHQMAQYDLPAAFRYINNVTGKKIHYIGHSQGVMTMLIALTQHYKYVQENLLSFNAFGPVAYLKNVESKAIRNLNKLNLPQQMHNSEINKILLSKEIDLQMTARLCLVTPIVCNTMLEQISEKNNTVNNLQRLPIILGHFPSGSSTKNFVHFDQFVKKEQFKRYDYGKNNQLHYGQKTPPFYKLSEIKVPVHLHVGNYDKLADLKDSQKLFNQLTNSAGKSITLYDYGHATFVWGKSLSHVDNAIKVIEKVEADLRQAWNKPKSQINSLRTEKID